MYALRKPVAHGRSEILRIANRQAPMISDQTSGYSKERVTKSIDDSEPQFSVSTTQYKASFGKRESSDVLNYEKSARKPLDVPIVSESGNGSQVLNQTQDSRFSLVPFSREPQVKPKVESEYNEDDFEPYETTGGFNKPETLPEIKKSPPKVPAKIL